MMFAKEVYEKRRERLKQAVGSGVILLPGNSQVAMNYPDNCYPFRQDSNFIYFVGLDTPDLFYLMDIDRNEEFLFGDELTMDDIIWMGDLPSLKSRALSSGLSNVLPCKDLGKIIGKANGRTIHYLKPYRYQSKLHLSELFGQKPVEIGTGFSELLTKTIVEQRLIKEDEEIAELENAAELGFKMHLAAMKMCRSGMSEQEIAGVVEGLAVSFGNRVSFPTILSQNGQILHNHNHSEILQAGRLMLMDAGAENVNYYASDFTRTIAVDGKYSQKQKEIYNIVLEAINSSIAMIKPGILYRDVHREAYRIVFDGLKALGITKGNTDDALEAGAPALFMPHGLGHAMGLDVHDMEDLGEDIVGYDEEVSRSNVFGYRSLRFARRLQKGHVLTVEPGIYFIPQLIEKWESEKINTQYVNFDKLKDYYDFGGIRLEDDVLITGTSCRLLVKERLPITIEEIETTVNG